MPATHPEAPQPSSPPPGRRRRIVRTGVIALIAIPAAIWLVLFVTKGRFLKQPFESMVGRLTHRTVRVRGDFQLYFAPWTIKLLAEGLTISNPGWATRPNLFEARRLDTRIAPLSLIFGKRTLRWLTLDGAALDLEWNAAHTTNSWTFSETKGGKPLDLPRIDRATVTGTTVRYRDPRLRLLADLGIDTIRSTDARIGDSVGVQGKGFVRGTPFTVVAKLLSPNATVARGENRLMLTARAADTVIDVSGTLPSLADIEDVPLRTRARGRNLADLLGIIDIAIPQTRRYALAAQLVKAGPEYRFTKLAGEAGDTDLAGRFTVDTGKARTHVDAALRTRRLDIVDAAPFLGYNPDTVAERGVVAAAAETGAAPARLFPDASLPVAAMQRFDADLVWTVGVVRSRRVPIADIKLTLSLNKGLLKLSPFTFAMARGDVAADVTIDSRRRPARNTYDIRLAPTPMGRLLAGYGLVEAGTTGTIRGRIQLAGDGDSIHDSLSTARGRIAFVMPSGSLWTRNVQLSELDLGTFVQKMFQDKLKEPVQLNCGLVGFTVRNGVAAADPILIDTQKNVIVGRGGFSFRTEAIDLAFRADGKKFSLLSGQSPVGLGGYFSRPSLDVVSSQLVGRAGATLGLALVATPVAGVLAFVDVGDAKSAACGPVLASATATAQRTTKGAPRDDVGKGTTAKTEDGSRTTGEKTGQRKKFLGIF